MGNPNPVGKWQKGQSGNLSGRPKGILTVDNVKIAMTTLQALTVPKLKEKMDDAATSTLERMIGAVILKTIEIGDSSRLEFLLARTIGRVTEVVEQHNHDHKDLVKDIPTEDLVGLVRRA